MSHTIEKTDEYLKRIFELEIDVAILKNDLALAEFQMEVYKQINEDLNRYSKKLLEWVG